MRTDVIKFPSELTNDVAELQSGSICIKTLYHSRNAGRPKSNKGHNELSSFSQMLCRMESWDDLCPPMWPNEGLWLSLAPQGFYDAINAYGLLPLIINLDKATQSHTKAFVQTVYGVTGPIVVGGFTKQGGLLSPLKPTMTTSLDHP